MKLFTRGRWNMNMQPKATILVPSSKAITLALFCNKTAVDDKSLAKLYYQLIAASSDRAKFHNALFEKSRPIELHDKLIGEYAPFVDRITTEIIKDEKRHGQILTSPIPELVELAKNRLAADLENISKPVVMQFRMMLHDCAVSTIKIHLQENSEQHEFVFTPAESWALTAQTVTTGDMLRVFENMAYDKDLAEKQHHSAVSKISDDISNRYLNFMLKQSLVDSFGVGHKMEKDEVNRLEWAEGSIHLKRSKIAVDMLDEIVSKFGTLSSEFASNVEEAIRSFVRQ